MTFTDSPPKSSRSTNSVSGLRWASVAALVLSLAACEGGNVPAAPELQVLSSRAELVTGTDSLIRVTAKTTDTAALAQMRVQLNGVDQTTSFKPDPLRPGSWVGLVSGVRSGTNTLVAATGGTEATLALTGYAATGPMISGPQQAAFTCTTDLFAYLPDKSSVLPSSTTANGCAIDRRVDYVYRTTAGTFKTLDSLTAYPTDLSATIVNGSKYIVRIETGTLNRSIYQMAMVHDPVAEATPTPLAPSKGWNNKLIYSSGGGCNAGYNTQGTQNSNNVNVLDDGYLSAGFAHVSSTLNTAGNNCNDLLAAETTLMIKERFIKAYGTPRFTIGTGSSGGAYLTMTAAENYPGVFDGVVTTNTFPDAMTNLVGLADARLLDIYFNATNVSGALAFTAAQKNAVTGWYNPDIVQILSDRASGPGANGGVTTSSANRLDPARSSPIGCARATVNSVTSCLASNAAGAGAPFYPVGTNDPAKQFDATNNPIGVRTSVIDHNINILGRRAAGTSGAGFSQRFLDNVGVQYGLDAFNKGVISFQQFVDLNQKIGGLDINFQPQSARTVADTDALGRVYKSGRVVTGANGLASIPIITRMGYNDRSANASTASGRQATLTHAKIWVHSLRERLKKSNGNADNHVILGSTNAPASELIPAMDAWLSAIYTDTTSASTAQKIVRNKPATVVDACWDTSVPAQKLIMAQTLFGSDQCNTLYPAQTMPAMVAGASVTLDTFKCQLKPVSQTDYTPVLGADQLATLQAVFPQGVCDWSKPGVGQGQPVQTWASFGPSPVNQVFDVNK